MLTIIPIQAFADNYIWLISQTNSRDCAVVDPGDAMPVLSYLKEHGLSLSAILITHHHWDHSGGVLELTRDFPVPVYAPLNEAVEGAIKQVGEGSTVQIDALNLSFQVLDIPGHTKGHVAYYNDEWLFCGDTLFAAGCGRLFEGTPKQMLASLKKLAVLPGKTQVYCGHEYTEKNLEFASTIEPHNPDILKRYQETVALRRQQTPTLPSSIALELKTNPFLRCHVPAVKKAAEAYYGRQLSDEAEIFTAIRELKNQFT